MSQKFSSQEKKNSLHAYRWDRQGPDRVCHKSLVPRPGHILKSEFLFIYGEEVEGEGGREKRWGRRGGREEYFKKGTKKEEGKRGGEEEEETKT